MAGRLSKEYITWRAAVIKRDGRKCQYPGCKRRSKLEIHHIVPWSISHSLRYEVSNGITLCQRCHYKIKGKEGSYSMLFAEIVRQKKDKK